MKTGDLWEPLQCLLEVRTGEDVNKMMPCRMRFVHECLISAVQKSSFVTDYGGHNISAHI